MSGSENQQAFSHEVFVDTRSQPEVIVEQKIILEQIMKEIQSLPTGGIRNTLTLCYEGFHSPKEIAELTGQTYKSTRSNMSRGRKLLRTRLIEWTGEEQNA
jgi:DNA-directed RNA polymerase specialized sigma24 family protein